MPSQVDSDHFSTESYEFSNEKRAIVVLTQGA